MALGKFFYLQLDLGGLGLFYRRVILQKLFSTIIAIWYEVPFDGVRSLNHYNLQMT